MVARKQRFQLPPEKDIDPTEQDRRHECEGTAVNTLRTTAPC
jgi:hypothetical protein